MSFRKKISAGAVALVLSAGMAAAAPVQLVDFTRDAPIAQVLNGSVAFAGSTVTYTITGNPVAPNNNQFFDGPGGGGPNTNQAGTAAYCAAGGGQLACRRDGLGVRDDEVTNIDAGVTPPLQSITITFSQMVNLIAFHALDLFRHPGAHNPGREEARVYANGDRGTTLSLFAEERRDGVLGGYAVMRGTVEAPLFANVRSLTFYTGPGNDGAGNPDWALAAIEIAAIPLPAPLVMLLAGLGGLVGLRRFRREPAA